MTEPAPLGGVGAQLEERSAPIVFDPAPLGGELDHLVRAGSRLVIERASLGRAGLLLR